MSHSMKVSRNSPNKGKQSPRGQYVTTSQPLNFKSNIDNRNNSQKQLNKQSSSQLLLQEIAQFSLKDVKSKAKSFIIDKLKKAHIASNFSTAIFNDIESLDHVKSINHIFQVIFAINANLITQMDSQLRESLLTMNNKQSQRQIALPIRSRQAKLIRLVKQDPNQKGKSSKSKSAKKISDFQKQNISLKKELFQLKQEKQSLQRKMVFLIQQYQSRKNLYLSQIKKLTNIIKMSTADVRTLVLQKTKQAMDMQSRQDKVKKPENNAGVELNSPQNYKSNHQFKDMFTATAAFSNMPKEMFTHDKVYASNGYNTELRVLNGVSSIQQFQQEKGGSRISF